MVNTFKRLLGHVQDKAMFGLIGRSIIYNVSWEDPRIDCELLDLGPDDTILMLTSGGCNVLDMVIEGASRVVAADLNPRQNALLEIKIRCIQQLTYEQFYQIFARSNETVFREVYESKIRPVLSEPAREFWDENQSFFKSVMWGGMSGFAAHLMLRICQTLGLSGLIEGAYGRGCDGGRGSRSVGLRAFMGICFVALTVELWKRCFICFTLAEVRSCATLDDQRAVYRRYQGRVAMITNIMNFTRRLWCPLIAVPANQVSMIMREPALSSSNHHDLR
jgi:hypothetical protein